MHKPDKIVIQRSTERGEFYLYKRNDTTIEATMYTNEFKSWEFDKEVAYLDCASGLRKSKILLEMLFEKP